MQSQQIAGILLFLVGLTLSLIVNLITSETKILDWYNKNRALVLLLGLVLLFVGPFLILNNSPGLSVPPSLSSTAELTTI